jgi:hypothetical protein
MHAVRTVSSKAASDEALSSDVERIERMLVRQPG